VSRLTEFACPPERFCQGKRCLGRAGDQSNPTEGDTLYDVAPPPGIKGLVNTCAQHGGKTCHFAMTKAARWRAKRCLSDQCHEIAAIDC
jgi:hypothetical protein